MYNFTMNCRTSILYRCAIAALLLLTLWVGGVQDLWSADQPERGVVVLSLDGDQLDDDARGQDILLSAPLIFSPAMPQAAYRAEQTRVAHSRNFPPPYRPPAEFA